MTTHLTFDPVDDLDYAFEVKKPMDIFTALGTVHAEIGDVLIVAKKQAAMLTIFVLMAKIKGAIA